MLEVPQRREFATRDEFVAAMAPAMAELQNVYDSEPVLALPPSWTEQGRGATVFHVALPSVIAETPRGTHALIRSLILGLKDKRKFLQKIARVESNGTTTIWALVSNG